METLLGKFLGPWFSDPREEGTIHLRAWTCIHNTMMLLVIGLIINLHLHTGKLSQEILSRTTKTMHVRTKTEYWMSLATNAGIKSVETWTFSSPVDN